MSSPLLQTPLFATPLLDSPLLGQEGAATTEGYAGRGGGGFVMDPTTIYKKDRTNKTIRELLLGKLRAQDDKDISELI